MIDIDDQDYSPARRLCREGYAVSRPDIAGFGCSGKVVALFIESRRTMKDLIRKGTKI